MSSRQTPHNIYRVYGGGTVLVLGCRGSMMPELIYFGPAENAPDHPALPDLTVLPSGPDIPVPTSLFPEHGTGFFGEPALLGLIIKLANGKPASRSKTLRKKMKTKLILICTDQSKNLELRLLLHLDPASGLLISHTVLTNTGNRTLHLSRLAALALPLPDWARQHLSFSGYWANEAHLQSSPILTGKYERTSRSGRPGFDWGQFCLVTDNSCRNEEGKALGLHLAWSGNHHILLERDAHGASQLQASEWLAPGEISLATGESYTTPEAMIAVSHHGLNGIRTRYHAYALQKTGLAARPAQLNTWEGVYFDVSEKKVIDLAKAAAALGFERFVLDDGWFKGREDDTTSLGDWTPDPDRFPNGLTPVISAIKDFGMSFGLWVEPEMVNPDSDLYRTHPDWVLHLPGQTQPLRRNQLMLDLTRPEVKRYILETITNLLSSHDIDYLKWDYNREMFPGSTIAGPRYHRQARALYEILEQLKTTFPDVMIESCSSGGARIDYGILKYADRVWPSDNTDAVERIRIQRNLSLFLPFAVIGSHVGPAPYEMTGSNWPMAFRCLVALFGHFGAELDPRSLVLEDAEVLKEAVRHYKLFRTIIHSGEACLSCIIRSTVRYSAGFQ